MVNGYKIGSVLFVLNMFTIALLVVVSIVLRTLPHQNYRLLYVYNVLLASWTLYVTDCSSCVCIKSGSGYA